MLEILLNAVQLAMSPEARRLASDLVSLVRNAPAWKDEVCSIEARIPFSEAEIADVIIELITEKLTANGYHQEKREAVHTICKELVSNAFRHGCRNDGLIRVIVDITASACALQVFNDRRVRIAPDILGFIIDDNHRVVMPRYDPSRGRGLYFIYELSDSIALVDNGIKVVVEKGRFVYSLGSWRDYFHHVRVFDGLPLHSFSRRVKDLLTGLYHGREIFALDFRPWETYLQQEEFDRIAGRIVLDIAETGEAAVCGRRKGVDYARRAEESGTRTSESGMITRAYEPAPDEADGPREGRPPALAVARLFGIPLQHVRVISCSPIFKKYFREFTLSDSRQLSDYVTQAILYLDPADANRLIGVQADDTIDLEAVSSQLLDICECSAERDRVHRAAVG